MGLFDLFRTSKAKTEPAQSAEADKVERVCDLPSGWLYANRKFTETSKDQYHYFLNEFANVRKEKDGIRAKYAALKSLVIYMEDLKRICESKGENFARWYSLFIADSDELSYRLDELREMEENMDELIKKENLSKKLKKELVSIIEKEPGVIQADLYKRFDPELKPEVSNQLYLLSAKGLIIREKSGRSYKLYIS